MMSRKLSSQNPQVGLEPGFAVQVNIAHWNYVCLESS